MAFFLHISLVPRQGARDSTGLGVGSGVGTYQPQAWVFHRLTRQIQYLIYTVRLSSIRQAYDRPTT